MVRLICIFVFPTHTDYLPLLQVPISSYLIGSLKETSFRRVQAEPRGQRWAVRRLVSALHFDATTCSEGALTADPSPSRQRIHRLPSPRRSTEMLGQIPQAGTGCVCTSFLSTARSECVFSRKSFAVLMKSRYLALLYPDPVDEHSRGRCWGVCVE